MFRLLSMTLTGMFLMAGLQAQAQQMEPNRVTASFGRIYVPTGFDSNDHVQIAAEGEFKNSCFRPAPNDIKVDEAKKKVVVGPAAYEYSGICLQVIVPYVSVIDLGILKPGNWEVIQKTQAQEKSLGMVLVKPATSRNADDFLYAPIRQAYFAQSGQNADITLTGEFTNSCMSLEEVRTLPENDAIVIQPIAHMDEKSDCKDGKFPFSKTVTVQTLPKGKYLLHVRSMNGNAVNNLVEMQ